MIFKFLFFLISLIPINSIKIFLLNFLPNISIDQESKIGIGVVLDCKEIKIANSKVGNFNLVKCGCFKLVNSKIANNNIFLNINKFNAYNFSIIGSHNFILSKSLTLKFI